MPVSQADSYLVPAGHAQEEAEGPSQRGACPGPRVFFQLFTTAKRPGRGKGRSRKGKQTTGMAGVRAMETGDWRRSPPLSLL